MVLRNHFYTVFPFYGMNMNICYFARRESMNPYEILGVSPLSSKADIKAAYRRLSKKYHPDLGGDEEKFKEINEAWDYIDKNHGSESAPVIWVHKTLFTFKRRSVS